MTTHPDTRHRHKTYAAPPTPEQTRSALVEARRRYWGWPSVVPLERCWSCGCVKVAGCLNGCGWGRSGR